MYRHAIILAGGRGTRLMPLTKDLPKPLVQVGGKPFLRWQLTYLRDQGVREATLLVAHMANKIIDYFKTHPIDDLSISYSIENEPLGTGGALKNALHQLPESFWLFNGDSFLPLDLRAMASFHALNRWEATIAAVSSDRVSVSGNLRVKEGKVLEYNREAEFAHVDGGVYLISKNLVREGPTGQADLGVFWQGGIQRGTIGAYMVNDRFFDIGTPERLKTFEQHLKNYFDV